MIEHMPVPGKQSRINFVHVLYYLASEIAFFVNNASDNGVLPVTTRRVHTKNAKLSQPWFICRQRRCVKYSCKLPQCARNLKMRTATNGIETLFYSIVVYNIYLFVHKSWLQKVCLQKIGKFSILSVPWYWNQPQRFASICHSGL